MCKTSGTEEAYFMKYSLVKVQCQKYDKWSINSFNSLRFISIHSVIVGKIKTSYNKNATIIPYKVYAGTNGNIIQHQVFKSVYHRATIEQLEATKTWLLP